MNSETIKETNQYLTFRLGEEIFAVKVTQVREVLDICTITRVPQAPDFMRGVINVRGSVVPVADLRIKFGMTATENTLDSRIVVMELSLDSDQSVLGCLADSVHEVTDLDNGQIEDPPNIGAGWRMEFISGIGKRNDEFIMILDMDRIFSSDEIAIAQETGNLLDIQREDKKAA